MWHYIFNFDVIMWVLMLFSAYYFATRLHTKYPKYEVVDVEFENKPQPQRTATQQNAQSPPQQPPQPSVSSVPFQKTKRLWKNEERCRQIFEKIFGVKFESVRPDFLKNPVTNRNLELDGYNPTIKTKMGRGLAFERDGEQHAMYIPSMHKNNPQEFIYQDLKDKWKSEICKKEGIMLIRIGHEVAYDDLERYIIAKLRMNGVIHSNSKKSLYE